MMIGLKWSYLHVRMHVLDRQYMDQGSSQYLIEGIYLTINRAIEAFPSLHGYAACTGLYVQYGIKYILFVR